MATVDVVIVTYNSHAHVRACVERLAGREELNVIVVDSASTDGTLRELEDMPVTVVPLTKNRGFGHACNAGWQQANAPYVLFLNPDAQAEPSSVSTLAAALENDARLGAVGPKIVEADDVIDFSIREYPRLRSTYAQAFFLHRAFPHAHWVDEVVRDPAAYRTRRPAPWLSGACLLVRRDLLDLLGGFDDGFFLYCEDLDLCRRIRSTGAEIEYVPEAVVFHEGGASMPRPSLLAVLAESRIRYAHKHRGRAAAAVERLGIALGALTHAVLGRSGTRAGHLRALLTAAGLRRASRPATQEAGSG